MGLRYTLSCTLLHSCGASRHTTRALAQLTSEADVYDSSTSQMDDTAVISSPRVNQIIVGISIPFAIFATMCVCACLGRL